MQTKIQNESEKNKTREMWLTTLSSSFVFVIDEIAHIFSFTVEYINLDNSRSTNERTSVRHADIVLENWTNHWSLCFWMNELRIFATMKMTQILIHFELSNRPMDEERFLFQCWHFFLLSFLKCFVDHIFGVQLDIFLLLFRCRYFIRLQ